MQYNTIHRILYSAVYQVTKYISAFTSRNFLYSVADWVTTACNLLAQVTIYAMLDKTIFSVLGRKPNMLIGKYILLVTLHGFN